MDHGAFRMNANSVAFSRTESEGATVAKIWLYWKGVAPATAADLTATPGYTARSWDNPAYDWSDTDEQVVKAAADNLGAYIQVFRAPTWAQGANPPSTSPGGGWKVNIADFVDFMYAVADRYNGTHSAVVDGTLQTLPRVHWFGIWNEPNYGFYFGPQVLNGKDYAAPHYRDMLNQAYPVIREAQAPAAALGEGEPRVIAGETGPFKHVATNTAPLDFMRQLFCIQPRCSKKTHFDIWAHHPYTAGSPWHHSDDPNGVSLIDLSTMHDLLISAARARKTASLSLFPQRLWVTEFAWDTNPVDPGGVPARLQQRWIAEALYVAQRAGVQFFGWFNLRDRDFPLSYWQSGLWRCRRATVWNDCSDIMKDVPKPGFFAFRFPFVAYPRRKGVVFWGRAPWGQHSWVNVERRTSAGWIRIGRVHTNVYGLFSGLVRTSIKTGSWRASFSIPTGIYGSPDPYTSPPFSLVPPPNENMLVQPFGCVRHDASKC